MIVATKIGATRLGSPVQHLFYDGLDPGDYPKILCKVEMEKFSGIEAAVKRGTDQKIAHAIYDLMKLAEVLVQRAKDNQLFDHNGELSNECGVCFVGTRGAIGEFSAWIHNVVHGWMKACDAHFWMQPVEPLPADTQPAIL